MDRLHLWDNDHCLQRNVMTEKDTASFWQWDLVSGSWHDMASYLGVLWLWEGLCYLLQTKLSCPGASWACLTQWKDGNNSIMVILWEFFSWGTAINSPLLILLQQHLWIKSLLFLQVRHWYLLRHCIVLCSLLLVLWKLMFQTQDVLIYMCIWRSHRAYPEMFLILPAVLLLSV